MKIATIISIQFVLHSTKIRNFLGGLLGILCLGTANAQNNSYALFKNDTLKIGNNLIERVFLWNNGNLITCSIEDKENHHKWENISNIPDFQFTKDITQADDADLIISKEKETSIHPAYTRVEVYTKIQNIQTKRVFKVFDNCPAIACHTFLKGNSTEEMEQEEKIANSTTRKNIESVSDMQPSPTATTLDKLYLKGKHWHATCVEFFDVTDWNNNLIQEKSFLSYRKTKHKGNLLMVREGISGNGFFFLKEAPCPEAQIGYKGVDFITDFGTFEVTGMGITLQDITPNQWIPAYGCVTGVYGQGKCDALFAISNYQKNIRRLLPDRDEMIMMNTWGDRSQDTKINEQFCLQELEKGALLGITHFQIDDGWQTGKSPNSGIAKGSFKDIWNNPEYWTPDKHKYPNGLTPIVKRGKELGIKIALWFNPSIQEDFACWEQDAEAIIKLYHTYGIKIYKIDGLSIPNKQTEINLRKFFNRILEETNYEVVFNLDVTAGQRGGYHIFNEYGNFFLENRYTDWQNYYPYWTLRNLWCLSKYVPAEKLQIEFLNKWRNTEKYKNDIFGPANYSFEYLFAITMIAQPLAWFESSNLPQEAFCLKEQIHSYKKFQHKLHEGIILPIGNEPSGRSWTGFQSINKQGGYFIVFREYHPETTCTIPTWLNEGELIKCIPLLGHGKGFTAKAGENGGIRFSLPKENDYVVYQYEIIPQI